MSASLTHPQSRTLGGRVPRASIRGVYTLNGCVLLDLSPGAGPVALSPDEALALAAALTEQARTARGMTT